MPQCGHPSCAAVVYPGSTGMPAAPEVQPGPWAEHYVFPYRFSVGETVTREDRFVPGQHCCQVQITHRTRVFGFPLYDIAWEGAVVEEDCPEYNLSAGAG
jgi:hypothetical protein